MMTKQVVAFLLVCCLAFATTASAWWAGGHMVTAAIAKRHMSADAFNYFHAYVEYTATRYPDVGHFVEQGPWMDDIKKFSEEFSEWHFQDQCYSPDKLPCPPPETGIHVGDAIKMGTKYLSGSHDFRNGAFWASALIHFVGDAHQPLHTCSRITPRCPNGDRGGNEVKVYYNGQEMVLHAFYDSVAMLIPNDPARPFSTNPASERFIDNFTNWVESNYKVSEAEATNTNVTYWLREGLGLCETIVYNYNTLHNGDTLSPQYVADVRPVLAKQLLLGGRRLAALFEQIYATQVHLGLAKDGKPVKRGN